MALVHYLGRDHLYQTLALIAPSSPILDDGVKVGKGSKNGMFAGMLTTWVERPPWSGEFSKVGMRTPMVTYYEQKGSSSPDQESSAALVHMPTFSTQSDIFAPVKDGIS